MKELCSLMINDLSLNRNHLKVDIALRCGYDDPQPKIRAVFDREGEIRRLPLLIKGTFRRKEKSDCIHIFSYKYSLDRIFLDVIPDRSFSLSFEVSFGDEVCPCDVLWSRGLANKYDVSNSFVAGEVFDGATVYTNQDDQDEDENTDEYIFSISSNENEGKIIIGVAKNDYVKKLGFIDLLSGICRFITAVFIILLCVILLPYFAIDGFLAALGLIPQRKYMPTSNIVGKIVGQIKTNIVSFFRTMFKSRKSALKIAKISGNKHIRYYNRLCKKNIVENRVAFVSGRRDEISGNEKFVFDKLKDNKELDFKFLMCSDYAELMKPKNIRRFYELYASSKVLIVDDYFTLLNTVKKREETTLFQLWHACGAFKTFGFSRLGKTGGPKQSSPDHRMYDKTVVSSEGIRKYYAEGFGIDEKKVLATGIPRTDIFFDDNYSREIRNSFYERFPDFKNKKIVLFAPTFRGNGQKSAYYPADVFSPEKFCDALGEDYALIIKLHPFCRERFEIPEEYAGRIIDLSDADELNDLLFVTSLLITDYSSAVFEASLLNIPMLFYAFDLYQYITERDFYCDFESFVPGKIVFTYEELVKAAVSGDFDSEKVIPFKNRFFTFTDGNSSQRVADAILEAVKK
ncbi:MAG: CDP-glycerol glycerophosphotransferase family protein [Clostridiales bacterium]|nr:CDP-glycerol glycerophosphotransferase family protein [Clostridiales bacterium]